jgi:hypothetical protein
MEKSTSMLAVCFMVAISGSGKTKEVSYCEVGQQASYAVFAGALSGP